MVLNNKKKASIGSWITLPSYDVTEIMCLAGFDWLVVDLEHSSISLSQAQNIIRIIKLYKITPYVRIPSIDENIIKRVLDMGAEGIIVPNVQSLNDVNNAYALMKYPNKGKRGIGLARAQEYGNKFHEYFNWQKNNLKLIIQIENINAVSQLDKIFTSKKIHSFIIGPYDLSGSMGIPGDFGNQKFKNIIKKIMKLAEKYQVRKGIHVIEPNIKELKKYIKLNYDFIGYSLDIRFLNSRLDEFKIQNSR